MLQQKNVIGCWQANVSAGFSICKSDGCRFFNKLLAAACIVNAAVSQSEEDDDREIRSHTHTNDRAPCIVYRDVQKKKLMSEST